MEGGTYDPEDLTVHLSQEISTPLQPLTLKWRQAKEGKGIVQEDEIQLPVYLNKTRKNLVFSIRVRMGGSSRFTLYQKGLAIILFT